MDDTPLVPGNIDLAHRPRVKNKDGSVSTIRSIGVNIDGREVLLPTVSDDGRIMSDDEAVGQYLKTGRHLGMFSSPEASTSYAQKLHQQQEKLMADESPEEKAAREAAARQRAIDAYYGGVQNADAKYQAGRDETAAQNQLVRPLAILGKPAEKPQMLAPNAVGDAYRHLNVPVENMVRASEGKRDLAAPAGSISNAAQGAIDFGDEMKRRITTGAPQGPVADEAAIQRANQESANAVELNNRMAAMAANQPRQQPGYTADAHRFLPSVVQGAAAAGRQMFPVLNQAFPPPGQGAPPAQQPQMAPQDYAAVQRANQASFDAIALNQKMASLAAQRLPAVASDDVTMSDARVKRGITGAGSHTREFLEAMFKEMF